MSVVGSEDEFKPVGVDLSSSEEESAVESSEPETDSENESPVKVHNIIMSDSVGFF